MKTATVRDLRNEFARVAAWIENGEEVVITKAGKFFARLVPAQPAPPPKLVKPDIMARLRKTWGDRVFSAKEVAYSDANRTPIRFEVGQRSDSKRTAFRLKPDSRPG